jgi:hypothetical protein
MREARRSNSSGDEMDLPRTSGSRNDVRIEDAVEIVSGE